MRGTSYNNNQSYILEYSTSLYTIVADMQHSCGRRVGIKIRSSKTSTSPPMASSTGLFTGRLFEPHPACRRPFTRVALHIGLRTAFITVLGFALEMQFSLWLDDRIQGRRGTDEWLSREKRVAHSNEPVRDI